MFIDNFIPSMQVGPQGVERSDYSGGVANVFSGRHFDPGLRRPYLDKYDRPRVTVNTGRWTTEKGQRVPIRESVLLRDLILNGTVPPVFNATALRKEEWIELDRVVLRAARYRMRAWADLAAANSFGGFNGMSKMLLEHETMSDPGEAIVDMDGLSEGRGDAPLFQLEGLPLPITHSDFWFSSRVLAISRNTGTPLDTTMGESAGRRIGEMIEKTTIGNQTGVTYGGNSTQVGGYGRTSKVYGYMTFPSRLVKINLSNPSSGAWTPEATQIDVNNILNTLRNNKFFGPFMMYHSNDWDPYLDGDYYVAKTSGAVAPTKSLRNRLREIDGILDVRRLDFLFSTAPSTDPTSSSYGGPGGDNLSSTKVAGKDGTTRANTTSASYPTATGANPFTLIFVQMTPDVARAVSGMDITTVQWESVGGMRVNFKVMCIQVPQLRADYYSNCGILQATIA